MIAAHQSRIEELRESFKRKMAETERWPEKVFLQTAFLMLCLNFFVLMLL